MKRIATFSPADITHRIGLGMPKFTLHTHLGAFKVKASSDRLECLKRNPNCVRCGIKGTIWTLECSVQKPRFVGHNCFIEECPFCALKRPFKDRKPGKWDTPHLNLYARHHSGRLILMTQDHIMPKHAGGSNGIENLQTMCRRCNSLKGGMLPHEYQEHMLPHERARYLARMDGGGATTGGLPSVHTPLLDQAHPSDCAAE